MSGKPRRGRAQSSPSAPGRTTQGVAMSNGFVIDARQWIEAREPIIERAKASKMRPECLACMLKCKVPTLPLLDFVCRMDPRYAREAEARGAGAKVLGGPEEE